MNGPDYIVVESKRLAKKKKEVRDKSKRTDDKS